MVGVSVGEPGPTLRAELAVPVAADCSSDVVALAVGPDRDDEHVPVTDGDQLRAFPDLAGPDGLLLADVALGRHSVEGPLVQVGGGERQDGGGAVGVPGAHDHPPDRPVPKHGGVAERPQVMPGRRRDHHRAFVPTDPGVVAGPRDAHRSQILPRFVGGRVEDDGWLVGRRAQAARPAPEVAVAGGERRWMFCPGGQIAARRVTPAAVIPPSSRSWDVLIEQVVATVVIGEPVRVVDPPGPCGQVQGRSSGLVGLTRGLLSSLDAAGGDASDERFAGRPGTGPGPGS